ncbi:RNA polymerase sigma factor [Xylanimonas protaetiae]|uniref:RNA polymerase sigma factor n=1 Tax=Xylanimonas protaetiae TaxID=2509457 RepID=UPI001F5DE8C7|nr:RNA polymerase sigma factor [Xylanimonas protaetiae]
MLSPLEVPLPIPDEPQSVDVVSAPVVSGPVVSDPSGELSASEAEALFAAHARTVYRYARTRVSAADAEDVVAEVFAIAWRKRDAVLVDSRAWLLGVARRVLANQVRAQGRRAALTERLRAAPAPPVPDGTGLVREVDELRRALARLRPADREVIALLASAELTTAEVAEALGCSPAGAATRVHRARRRLRAVYRPSTEEGA